MTVSEDDGSAACGKNERKRQNVADGSLAGDLARSPDLQKQFWTVPCNITVPTITMTH
jgi:hypothetical protein